MMPVIAEANNNFMAAMDSIGFTENERRSTAARFTGIGTGKPDLPDFTVSDLTDWIDRFASMEGPVNLTDSGQYGLEFVTSSKPTICSGLLLRYWPTCKRIQSR